MLLIEIPWAQRTWALTFFTVLAASERYHQERGERHKPLTGWARQMVRQVRRWCLQRAIVLVADSSFATLELLWAITQISAPVHMVTRLRVDAALYQPAPQGQLKQMGRPRKVGKRLPTVKALVENSYTPWQTVVIKDLR